MEKICSRCGDKKPVSQFSKHSVPRNDGVSYWCKACVKEWGDARRQKRREANACRPLPLFKRCFKCKQDKPNSEFHRYISSADGLTSSCKDCRNSRQTELQRMVDKETKFKHQIKRYGITVKDFQDLLAKQGGACAICHRIPDKKLCVDHCHQTKLVRGLLCRECNRGLGAFADSPERLAAAIQYLQSAVGIGSARTWA